MIKTNIFYPLYVIALIFGAIGCEKSSKVDFPTESLTEIAIADDFQKSLAGPPNVSIVARHHGAQGQICPCPGCKCPGCPCPLGVCVCRRNGAQRLMDPNNTSLDSVEIAAGYVLATALLVNNGRNVRLIFDQETALPNGTIPIPNDHVLVPDECSILGISSGTIVAKTYTVDYSLYPIHGHVDFDLR